MRWHIRKDGSRFFASGALRPIRGSEGTVYGFVKVARDITERIAFEEKIENYTRELRRSNTDLEQFAYIASHDLKEPLNLIAGYAQLLQKKYKDKILDGKACAYIDTICESTAQMQDLIKKLLQFAHIDQSRTPLGDVDCNLCLEKALNNLRLLIAEAKVAVKAEPLPRIRGDAIQITQIFRN